MDPLLFNVILYVGLLLYWLKKKRDNSILIYMTAIYSTVSIIAFLINDTQFYTWGRYYIYGSMLRNPVTLAPLLYIFIGYLIFTWPIKSWNNEKITYIYPINIKKANLFCYFSIALSLLFIFLEAKNAFSINDYNDTYLTHKSDAGGDKSIAHQIGIMCNGLRSASLILGFYYLTENVKKYTIGIILLTLTIFVRYIDASLAASRGVIFFMFFEIVVAFFLFRKFISKRIRRRIIVIGWIFFAFFLLLVISISIARFDTRVFNSIASYFGESFINFARIFWDFPADPLYGQYTFQTILKNDSLNTKIPTGLFKTFAGSAYIDFGKTGGLLFLIVQSMFWKTVLGKMHSSVNLQQLMIYHFIIIMILTGVFSTTYSGWSCYAMLLLSFFYFKNMQVKV